MEIHLAKYRIDKTVDVRKINDKKEFLKNCIKKQQIPKK